MNLRKTFEHGPYDARSLEELQPLMDQARERLSGAPIGIDPIEEVPFPIPPTAYDTEGEVVSWVLDQLGLDAFIDEHWDRLIDSPIRLVFVIHDTAGKFNDQTSLAPFQVREWNGDQTGTGAADDHNHGHNVASCIAGNKFDSRMGVLRRLAGLRKVVLVADKILTRGSGSFSWAATGINRTADLPFKENDLVIHICSFGARGASHSGTAAAIRRAIDKGQLVFVSAGNDGHDPSGASRVGFPASMEETIAVGAVDPSYHRKSYSSTGPEVYSTCGSGVPCENRDGSINNREGTSFSQPINAAVAGMYALYLGRKITQAEAKEIIRKYSIDLGEKGRDTFFGYGIQTGESLKTPKDDPGDVTPEPPDEEELKPYVLKIVLEDYEEHWKYMREVASGDPVRTINFRELVLTVTARKAEEQTVAELSELIRQWSRRHFLGVPDDWRPREVAAVATRFLDMHLDREYDLTIDPKIARIEADGADYILDYEDLQRWQAAPIDELEAAGFSLQLIEVPA